MFLKHSRKSNFRQNRVITTTLLRQEQSCLCESSGWKVSALCAQRPGRGGRWTPPWSSSLTLSLLARERIINQSSALSSSSPYYHKQVDSRGEGHLCMPRRGKEGKTENRWNDFPSRWTTPPTRWTEFPTSWNGYGALHTSQLHGYKPLRASGAFL